MFKKDANKRKVVALLKLIQQGECEVRARRTVPADEVFGCLRKMFSPGRR